jgi:hypothetical protein
MVSFSPSVPKRTSWWATRPAIRTECTRTPGHLSTRGTRALLAWWHPASVPSQRLRRKARSTLIATCERAMEIQAWLVLGVVDGTQAHYRGICTR